MKTMIRREDGDRMRRMGGVYQEDTREVGETNRDNKMMWMR